MKKVAVIMAGGGGTRFWPISRMSCPKQLVSLTSDEPMINETIKHYDKLISTKDTYIVTNREQAQLMGTLLPSDFDRSHILVEPVGKNTAPCVLYAAARLHKEYGDCLMAVLAADHHISDVNEYQRVLSMAFDAAENSDNIVTIGLWPTYPATGYGYIRIGEQVGSNKELFQLERFIEKPNKLRAQEYVNSRKYLWNSGMFIWRTSVILKAFQQYLPDMYKAFMNIEGELATEDEQAKINEIYPQLESISVDYGIMEKASNLYVIPAEFGWNDIGSWSALAEVFPHTEEDNVIRAPHVGIDTKNCIVFSKSGKRIITTVGVSDLVIVDTDDTIMVIKKDQDQDVKKLVEELRRQGRTDLL
ncbi:MAG: mannose-1-phosphate guanylyltransferase [Clostridiales bacterium]|nr:mannose-1-phosphate guanylyltransferase [Clostridiales bacterium]